MCLCSLDQHILKEDMVTFAITHVLFSMFCPFFELTMNYLENLASVKSSQLMEWAWCIMCS